jgi:hypothetical protein
VVFCSGCFDGAADATGCFGAGAAGCLAAKSERAFSIIGAMTV